jgi:peptidyl-prolyl cis-trans isomerase SurA
MFKHIFLIMSFLILLPAPAPAELIDRVVAVVNNDVITLSELYEESEPTFQKIRETAPPEQVHAALRKARQDILDSLIDRALIAQKAESSGLSVSDEDIDATIERIISQNNTTPERFQRELAKMGLSEDSYRQKIKSQMLQSKLINYEIRSKIVIPDEKVLQYYRESFGRETADDGYHLLQIGCGWGEKGRSETRIDAMKRAEQLRAMILEGESFKEIAKAYSDLSSAGYGGDIGVFKENELAQYMREAIVGLHPGQVSKIIETPSAFQFFKVLSAKQGDVVEQAPFASVKEEIRDRLYQQELRENFDKWLRQLREEAFIQKLL